MWFATLIRLALPLAVLAAGEGAPRADAAGVCAADRLGNVVCRPQRVGEGAAPSLPEAPALDPKTVPRKRLFLTSPALDRLGNRFVPVEKLAPPKPGLTPTAKGTRRCIFDRLGNLYCP